MIASVVSRVRRALRRQKSRYQLQPPDLRRWSDFMNPFPHVSPGGYRRYYETHGMPAPKSLPTNVLVSSPRQPTPRLQPQKNPSKSPSPSPVSQPRIATSSQVPFPPSLAPSTSSSPRRRETKKSGTLSTIPEASPSPVTARMPALSNTSSLRRRRRQLLRTPSVERDFPSRAPTIASSVDADADLEGFSSGSSQSHSSSTHPYSVDTPPTTVEGLNEDLSSPISAKEGAGYDEGDDTDPFERPDSRSSYCTARSDFSDD